MRTIKIFTPIIAFAILIFIACHKNETVTVDNETQSVVDNAIAEQEFMAMVPAVNSMAIRTKGTGADKNRSAATTTVACDSLHLISGDTAFVTSTTLSPHVNPTYSLSFANASCSPIPDSKIRQGSIKLTMHGPPKSVGSRITMTLTGYQAANTDPTKMITYSCDSIVLKTISNNTTTKIRVFEVIIYNGKCVGAGGSWTTYYSTDRFISHNMNNDDIQIWGSSNGINRASLGFTVSVDQTTPLTKHTSCQFISSGILKLTPSGFKQRVVDFASGTGGDACDDDATFTVNGNTIAFKLK